MRAHEGFLFVYGSVSLFLSGRGEFQLSAALNTASVRVQASLAA